MILLGNKKQSKNSKKSKKKSVETKNITKEKEFTESPTTDLPELEKEEIEHHKEVIEEASKKRGIDEEQVAMFRQFMDADADWHQGMTKKLMRKVDIHLLPLLILMYLLNFLDRK